MNTVSALSLASEFEAPLGWTSMPVFGTRQAATFRDVEAVAALVRESSSSEMKHVGQSFWTQFQSASTRDLAAAFTVLR